MAPIYDDNSATEKALWRLAQVLAEIARNNTEEGSDDDEVQ